MTKYFYLIMNILFLALHGVANFYLLRYIDAYLYKIHTENTYMLISLFCLNIILFLFKYVNQIMFVILYFNNHPVNELIYIQYVYMIDIIEVLCKVLYIIIIIGISMYIFSDVSLRKSNQFLMYATILISTDTGTSLLLFCIFKYQLIHNYYRSHQCAICLEENNYFLHQVKSCKHIFHISCFRKWCNQQAAEQISGHIIVSCPTCRSIIESADIFIDAL